MEAAAAGGAGTQWNHSFKVESGPAEKKEPDAKVSENTGTDVTAQENIPEPSTMETLAKQNGFIHFLAKVDFGNATKTEKELINLMAGASYLLKADPNGKEKSAQLQQQAMDIIKEELAKNPHFDINGPIGPDGDPLLKWATRFACLSTRSDGLYALCEFILKQESTKIDTCNIKDERPAIVNIAFGGSEKLFDLFFEYGAHIHISDKHDQSLLMKAGAGGNERVFNSLLLKLQKMGVLDEALSQKSKENWTVPIYAAKGGSAGILNALFKIPGKESLMIQALEHTDKKGRTPLHAPKTPMQTARRMNALEKKILDLAKEDMAADPGKSLIDCVKQNLNAELTAIRKKRGLGPEGKRSFEPEDNSVFRAQYSAITKKSYSQILEFLDSFLDKKYPAVNT